MKLKPVKQKAVCRTHFIDEAGLNKIHTKATDKRITVWLQLRAEGGRKRKIGVITKSTRTMFITRKREEHLMRKLNGYGFCLWFFQNQTTFNKINLKDDSGGKWEIPVEYLTDSRTGFFLDFKSCGFERQKFLSLEEIEKFKSKMSF